MAIQIGHFITHWKHFFAFILWCEDTSPIGREPNLNQEESIVSELANIREIICISIK